MLSFELTEEGRTILIHCDEEGMAALIKALERLRAQGDHVQVLTPSNGGHVLSEHSPSGKDVIREVIIEWEGD